MTRFRLVAFLVLFACSIHGFGCAMRIAPASDVEDPVAVYVVDYGRHSSLLLPTEPEAGANPASRSSLREYSFGDWIYYGQDRDSVKDGARALLWRSSGTFGRRDLPGLGPASDEAPIEPAARIQRTLGVERVIPLVVSREAASELLATLDQRFEAGEERGQPLANRVVGLDFVIDDRHYSLGRHCNHEVRDWLNALGADAKGAPLVSEFRIVEPD
jgi:hypothetical protein